MRVIQFLSIVLILLQTTFVLAEDPFCSEFDDVECGVTVNRAIYPIPSVETQGYRQARVNSWPWQVSIRRKQSDRVFKHECAGTLVSPTEVISAAHCLAFSDQVDDYEVQLGVHTLLADNATGIVKIKLIAFPEATDLKKLIFPSDIMVISLDSPVKYTDSIRPACIGFVESVLQPACYAIGWYNNRDGDSTKHISSTMKQSRIHVSEPDDCLEETGRTDDRNKIICARNDDNCQGDPGEALVCYVNNKWRLYGIARFRPTCDTNMSFALAMYSNMLGNSRFLGPSMLHFQPALKPSNMLKNCSNRHISEGSVSTINRIYATQSGTDRGAKLINMAPTLSAVEVANDISCGVPEFTPIVESVDRQMKIIGGTEVRKNSWPWQVSLRRKQSNGKFRHECGGTLLSPKVVISAVHCLTFSNDSKDFQVQLGAHNILETTDRILVKVSQFVYPSDNKPHKQNFPSDIMLVLLEQSVTFTDKISPACVGYEDINFSNVLCYTTGWGKNVSYNSMITSETLRQLHVPILSSEECQKHVKTNYSAERFMCAGSLAGGSDTCQGDSGGPLVCQVDQKWRLYGIVSSGDKCAKPNSPGVYTKVSGYSKFLQEHLPSFNHR